MFYKRKKEIINTLIYNAKLTKFSTETETYYKPLRNNLDYKWLKKHFGLKLKDKKDYAIVAEIQFDTEVIILQGCSYIDNDIYDDIFYFKLKDLNTETLKCLIDMFQLNINLANN